MRYVMSMVVIAAALSGLAILGTPHAAFAAGYDGNWTVLVITERGTCDRNYRYDVSVSQGKIHYPSYSLGQPVRHGLGARRGHGQHQALGRYRQRQRSPCGAHRRRRLARCRQERRLFRPLESKPALVEPRVPGAAQRVSGALLNRDPAFFENVSGPRICAASLRCARAASRPGHDVNVSAAPAASPSAALRSAVPIRSWRSARCLP